VFVTELFMSLQGESSFTGLPCVFVRLAGCNLGCSWCDTPEARVREGAREMTVAEIVDEVRAYGVDLVEITGGEPMLQEETSELAETLLAHFSQVLIETNGSVSLATLPERVVKVVDVKCPSSEHGGSFLMENLDCIQGNDEVKFVIGGREDYEFARDFVRAHLGNKSAKVLFAPVSDALNVDRLAGWVLDDRIKVRVQVQFHRYVWKETRGR